MTEHTLPCWLYHAEHAPKLIVTQAELDEAEAQGWRDSPAAAAAAVEPLPPVVAPVEPPAEAMPDDGVADALEAAEDAIEQAGRGGLPRPY